MQCCDDIAVLQEDGVRDTSPPLAETKTTPSPVPPCNEAEEHDNSFESTGFITADLLNELDELENTSKKPRLE